MEGERNSCLKCKHFYITWDNGFPRGCKLFGFKTAKLPSAAVKEATGEECKNFKLKDRLK
ncbi:MAG: uracil-DNA glycosylase [Bacillota bacterium]